MNISKKSFTMILNITIFGAEANNKVTLVIAPSYTSQSQEWKGAEPTLKSKETKINNNPKNKKISSEVCTTFIKYSKDVEPNAI